MTLIFDKSVAGRRSDSMPPHDVPVAPIAKELRRASDAKLCELTELDVSRHFTELSGKNFSIDKGFYPLGSCTMKYNPKVNELVAAMPGFAQLHPMLPQIQGGTHMVQGALEVLYRLEKVLCEVSGMDGCTLQPLAGANGELTGLMLIAAYHKKKGNNKREILIPDEAHGTNPSSAAIAGYPTRSVPTNTKTGMMDVDALRSMIGPQTAAIMLTNPNTLGIFNTEIKTVTDLAHQHDALVYYDGANLNAVLGKFRPGDAGIDVMHINVHKTFSTPHGCGGPGGGPVCVKKHLIDFLPISRVVKLESGMFALDYDYPETIGYIAPFYGNFGISLRALTYILSNGGNGMKAISENAVLNANYMMHKLKGRYFLPYEKICMHEFVITAKHQTEKGVHALDIAKALIDEGYHPPTIYFPLIVKEAMMIEPTESESKETLDAFIAAMLRIADKAETDPESFHAMPRTTPVSRPNETKAAKDMDVASR